MKEKKKITEEMKEHEKWYEEATEITLEELPSFINHLVNDYGHDYGTICHAMTAGAIATMWAMDKEDCGGITGFQANAIMWLFIRHWIKRHNKVGLKLVDYDYLLYPQYRDDFDKVLQPSTFAKLQEAAKENLQDSEHAHPSVIAHWKSIVDGIAPFGYEVKKDE